jgi:hypothetical protein
MAQEASDASDANDPRAIMDPGINITSYQGAGSPQLRQGVIIWCLDGNFGTTPGPGGLGLAVTRLQWHGQNGGLRFANPPCRVPAWAVWESGVVGDIFPPCLR